MRVPPGELVRVRTAAPPSTGRRTSRWPRTRGSRSRGARWGGSRRARPRRTCAAAGPAVRDDPGGAAPAPARGAPGRREHRPCARGLPPSSCRVRRGRSRPPRPYPTARRRRSGLAMASRRRPGMRVAAFSETLTGTASSRANTLPPTSPAATWHGTGGAGAPRSAAWPSRSSQRGGGSTLSSGSSPSAQCHPPAYSCGIGRCQRVSHSRMPNTDTPSSTNAPSPSYTTLSVAFSRPGIRPTVLRFRVNELR